MCRLNVRLVHFISPEPESPGNGLKTASFKNPVKNFLRAPVCVL